jgi:hypothetical protein
VAATILIFFSVRKPVLALIPLIRELKYKEASIKFAVAVEQVVHSVFPQESESLKLWASSSRHADRFNWRLLPPIYSSGARIAKAWIELERAALKLIESKAPNFLPQASKNPAAIGRVLASHSLLNDDQVRALESMRELRNEVRHLDFEPSESSAEDYERAAKELARQFAEKDWRIVVVSR